MKKKLSNKKVVVGSTSRRCTKRYHLFILIHFRFLYLNLGNTLDASKHAVGMTTVTIVIASAAKISHLSAGSGPCIVPPHVIPIPGALSSPLTVVPAAQAIFA